MHSVIGLQAAVGKPQRAQQFYAAQLKPDQVVGIVDNAHLIGLGIPHPHLVVTGIGVSLKLSTDF
jgi:hypothetical protein